MHVDGSTCFDRPTTIGLTGTLTGSNISLTSTPVAGQVITLAGTIASNGVTYVFTGNYAINGGCGNGDAGTVAGIYIYIEQALDGTLTSSDQKSFTVEGSWLDQSPSPNSDGSFGISGSASFGTCSISGNFTPGTASSGSYILGTTVGLELETSNGTLTFLGTLDLDSYDLEWDSYLINGNYTVSGGTCEGSGTVVLRVYNPYDY